jgi:hypothetical protein
MCMASGSSPLGARIEIGLIAKRQRQPRGPGGRPPGEGSTRVDLTLLRGFLGVCCMLLFGYFRGL